MALRNYPSPPLIIQKSVTLKNTIGRVLMLAPNGVSVKRSPSLQITSSFRNKVFEDQSTGIVCYRDASGEITCEGYDEGPRLQPQFNTTTCNPRDAEIIELLQKNWLQIVEGGELNLADNGVSGIKDFNWNRFDIFH